MAADAPCPRRAAPQVAAISGTITVLLGCAWTVVGVPDPALVRAFLAGGRPSPEAAAATAAALVWLALLGVSLWLMGATIGAVAPAVRSLEPRRDGWRRGVAVLVAGLVVLAAGAVRHQGRSPALCCGSTEEATHALGR